MYVVYINLLYFLSIFLFTYNKNLLSQKKISFICYSEAQDFGMYIELLSYYIFY